MNRLIVTICFYIPIIISCLNLQEMVSLFVSHTMAQFVAYFNLALIIIGIFLFRKNFQTTSRTNRLWFIFYILYYSFGLLATGMSGFKTSIIATLVPIVYFIGFYFLLSNKEQFKIFFKVITICFVISAFLTIILIKLNIDVYTGDVYAWDLDRAGGVTGDANAAAHNSIFAFILLHQLFKPTRIVFQIIKTLILLTIFYSLFLTFSTTGLFVFTIVFFLINYKFFTGIKLFLIAAVIPLFYAVIFAIKPQVHTLGLSEAQTGKVNNIINLLTFNIDEVDNSGRGDLVEKGLYYLNDHPFVGNGIYFSFEKLVHNTYVGIWVDSGLFTFLFFLFMLSCYFFRAFFLSPKHRFFAISILFVLYIFMISLQSIINQPHLIVLFVYIGYLIDNNKIDEDYPDGLPKSESMI